MEKKIFVILTCDPERAAINIGKTVMDALRDGFVAEVRTPEQNAQIVREEREKTA